MAAVEDLVKTTDDWVRSCQAINQDGYKKICIADVANGYSVAVIFFPKVDESKKNVRQAFIVAFMEAAERLGISLVPVNIMTDFSKNSDLADKAVV